MNSKLKQTLLTIVGLIGGVLVALGIADDQITSSLTELVELIGGAITAIASIVMSFRAENSDNE